MQQGETDFPGLISSCNHWKTRPCSRAPPKTNASWNQTQRESISGTKEWGPTDLFAGTVPTLQGWRTWDKQPNDPRGIYIRSKEAIDRWEHDKWSSAITFYEEKNMGQSRITSATADKQNLRVISPTEAERLLGSPRTGPTWRNQAYIQGKERTDARMQWAMHVLSRSSQGS